MPMIEMKIYESRLNPDIRRGLISKLTNAVVDVFGEGIREQTWIVLTPVRESHWGVAGTPGDD
jgi:4-oxalocrotonate tautomerase